MVLSMDQENDTKNILNKGPKGTSFEDAIIVDITNPIDGVRFEYFILRGLYPGYKLLFQYVMEPDVSEVPASSKKIYDVLEIKTSTNKKITIYFDITSFYGKY